jgi:hypothetical protein
MAKAYVAKIASRWIDKYGRDALAAARREAELDVGEATAAEWHEIKAVLSRYLMEQTPA